jgi:hypothetical protein
MRSDNMNHKDIAKTALDLNKATFDAVYEGLLLGEKYTENMVSTLLNQVKALPKEGRSKIDECGNFYKELREECKKTVDDSFKKCYDLVEEKKTCSAKGAPRKAPVAAKKTTKN